MGEKNAILRTVTLTRNSSSAYNNTKVQSDKYCSNFTSQYSDIVDRSTYNKSLLLLLLFCDLGVCSL